MATGPGKFLQWRLLFSLAGDTAGYLHVIFDRKLLTDSKKEAFPVTTEEDICSKDTMQRSGITLQLIESHAAMPFAKSRLNNMLGSI